MINILTDKDNRFKRQIEFLLGKEIPLTSSEINSIAHLTRGNLWILKILDKMNMTLDDIIYEEDREILRREQEESY